MSLYSTAVLLVVFGALMAALDALLLVATPRLLKRLARNSPGRKTDSILLVRSLPVGFAAAMTTLVFVPAWWRYEPQDSGEKASAFLLALAALSALPLLQGLGQAVLMLVRTRHRVQFWRGRGRPSSRVQMPFELVEVASEDLALCVGGYLRPTIYASADVMSCLEPEELSAALAHEVSHARRRDPLRLLWLGSCPDFLQLFRLDKSWRRAFTRACEFEADAGASGGNPELALDLAAALLKVARLRTFGPLSADPLADMAVSPAFSSRGDLEARVEFLANPSRPVAAAGSPLRPWMFVAALVLLSATGAAVSEQVHDVTEHFGHLLAP